MSRAPCLQIGYPLWMVSERTISRCCLFIVLASSALNLEAEMLPGCEVGTAVTRGNWIDSWTRKFESGAIGTNSKEQNRGALVSPCPFWEFVVLTATRRHVAGHFVDTRPEMLDTLGKPHAGVPVFPLCENNIG